MHVPTDRTAHTTAFDIPVMGTGYKAQPGPSIQKPLR